MRFFLPLMITIGCSEAEDSGPDFQWTGGDFDFLTTDVDDACLEGALEVLFMPEGPATPNAFEYPIYLPSYPELPMTYSVDLREPFVGMEITVREGVEGELTIRNSVMESVELGAATYGDCVVTMTVDADLVPTSASAIEGNATIEISEPRGSDERCPILDSDPCTVELVLTAQGS